MGWLSELASKEVRAQGKHPSDPALATWLGGGDEGAVTPDSAMRVTAVYACVSLIAETNPGWRYTRWRLATRSS